jgi:hypothetical protein
MEIEDATYDSSTTAALAGQSGLFKGEETTLAIGQSLVVGRSRLCGLSVARARECLRMGKEALEAHKSYRKISRQHFKVTFINADMLEVEDLSTNGTVVNGHRVDKLIISGFVSLQREVRIEFGDGELITVRVDGGTPSNFPRTQVQSIPSP